ENILLGREPRRAGGIIDRPALRQRAAALLQAIGSPIDPDARLTALTVAEQQMVELAKALSIDARILIMDEPTSALTDAAIEQLFSTIGRLTGRGAGIIYISHRLEELSRIGDRATVLRDGRLIATRTLPTPVPELVALMANRDVAHHYPPATRRRGEPILEVQDLARGPRLRGVTFTLHRGEILAVAGLLGAGRTEL